MKKRRIIVIVAIVALLAILAGVSLRYASGVAEPSGNSLDQEITWEEEHGLWEDFSQLERTPYEVEGSGGYVLHCEFVPAAQTSNRYVIISHGFGSNRYGAAKYVTAYRDLGFNCIIYDVRAHGENEKAVCTLGQVEAKDLLAIIDNTHARYGSDIVLGLHGESMGSSISISSLQYKPGVVFVVADCGFANLYTLLSDGAKSAHMSWLIPEVNLACQLRYGFDLHKTSPVDALLGNTVPLCLIHGENDTGIPPENSRLLQEATSGYSEIHIVPGAAHAESREVLGKDGYEHIIEEFLQNAGVL